ncbi:MAG: class I SAM-dependent methyltransferase [Phormidesmis sp.]
MKNQKQWKPSKFVYKKGNLVASRDIQEVNVASRLIVDLIAELYEENLRHYATGKLLDLGCGKVPLYHSYRKHVSEVICVDWENSLHKNEYLDCVCDLTQPLPFDNETFNTILLSDVLEHIPNPEQLWTEIARLLSPTGKLIMNVPFYYWLHEVPHDYYRYTDFALRRFVENAKMRTIKLQAVGGTPEILADTLSKHLKTIPVIGTVGTIGIQAFTKTFIKTTLGRKLSQKTSILFPLGYFLVAEKI